MRVPSDKAILHEMANTIAVLALPAETAYLHLGRSPVCFKYGSTRSHARDPKVGLALLRGVLLNVAAVNGFNVAVSEQPSGDSFIAELALDIALLHHALLHSKAGRAIRCPSGRGHRDFPRDCSRGNGGGDLRVGIDRERRGLGSEFHGRSLSKARASQNH